MSAEVVAGGDDPGRKAQTRAAGGIAPGYNFDVAYVAQLARLKLTPEEAALFQTQLTEVLAHAAKLQELDLSGVEPAAESAPAADVFRVDEVRPSLTQEEALRNAPRAANDLFIVPKVLE